MNSIAISEVKSARVFTQDPDIALHDVMIDEDPFFLQWDSVDRQRHGQTWCVFAAGVDVLPGVE